MFAILHDNMRNTRDTDQAVNRSLSIFLYVPFLELMMQRFGPVLWCFLPLHVQLVHFLQNKMAASRQRRNLNFIAHRERKIT